MWPTLWESPSGVALHTYGLMVLLGFSASLVWVQWRGASMGLASEKLPLTYVAAAIGGFTGAKLLYVVGTGEWSALTSLSGGLAWYGGLAGGALAAVSTARALGIDAWKLADATAPAIVLGGALGRTGCFFAGCCHGMPVPGGGGTALLPSGTLKGQLWAHDHFPWVSTSFEGGVARILDTPLYPTQMWQAVGSLAVFAGLTVVGRTRRFDGQVMAVFLMVEPVLRIVVESFRGDHRGFAVSWPADAGPSWWPSMAAGADVGDRVAGITTSQGIGLAMILGGAALWWWRRDAGVAEERPAGDAWVDDLVEG